MRRVLLFKYRSIKKSTNSTGKPYRRQADTYNYKPIILSKLSILCQGTPTYDVIIDILLKVEKRLYQNML